MLEFDRAVIIPHTPDLRRNRAVTAIHHIAQQHGLLVAVRDGVTGNVLLDSGQASPPTTVPKEERVVPGLFASALAGALGQQHRGRGRGRGRGPTNAAR